MKRDVRGLLVMICLLIVGPGLANATGNANFFGSWAMQVDGHNLFVLTLRPTPNGVAGEFSAPAKFSATNSIFTVTPGPAREGSVDGRFEEDVLHLTVRKRSDPNDTLDLAMTLKGDHAELAMEGLPPGAVMAPWIFKRASRDSRVFTGWDNHRAYTADDTDTPNTEMKHLYADDQRDREHEPIDWKTVNKADAARRARTRALLETNQLHTGADYREAAFIFQHGSSPDDYLLAHVLAMTAMAKGDPTAAWIAAATLDRYLQSIGRKQIFGTQESYQNNGTASSIPSGPYDSKLLPDNIKRQFGSIQ